jgi:hypothetical protein
MFHECLPQEIIDIILNNLEDQLPMLTFVSNDFKQHIFQNRNFKIKARKKFLTSVMLLAAQYGSISLMEWTLSHQRKNYVTERKVF